MDSERKREKERRLRASATFRSINRFALPSVIHNSQPLLRFHIFETSATALCGTTGIDSKDSRCLDTDCWCFGTLGQFVQVSVLALSSREAPPPNHLNTIQPQSLAPTRKPEVHSENTWRKHTRRLLDLSQFTGGQINLYSLILQLRPHRQRPQSRRISNDSTALTLFLLHMDHGSDMFK